MKWLLVIVSLCYTESQLIKDGKCPEMQAISSADLGKVSEDLIFLNFCNLSFYRF